METELERIAEKARSDTKLQFTSLAHHITRERVWKNLNKIPNNSASGVDGQSVPEAKEKGAIGLFESKYGDVVKVYTMGDGSGGERPFSVEICGGPHANNTSELGRFKIKKEESSSSGVRRIKALLIQD